MGVGVQGDGSASAETLLMFLFFFVLTMSCRVCGARQCSLLFSCFLGNCSFLLQAESAGCNSTFLLLHAYSPLPLMVAPVITATWVRNVEGEEWKGPGCMHESRAPFATHTQSFQPCSSLLAASWRWSSLCAQCHSCWMSPSQLLIPCPSSSSPGEGSHAQYWQPSKLRYHVLSTY